MSEARIPKPPGVSRRQALTLGIGAPLGASALLGLPVSPARAVAPERAIYEGFPSQDRERVRETVLKAHTDLDAVARLLEQSPALANAAVDWGFGDWESAIGAAAHMGRRDMAQLLLDHGARADLFTHAMMGNLAVVRAAVEAVPGIQRGFGPHGFTLLFHARAGGEPAAAVLAYLESLGDADPRQGAVPLDGEAASYTGTFSFGPGPGERFAIVAKDGRLSFEAEGSFPRALFHVGGDEFHPGGAPHVRIRIERAGGSATRVQVLDPELLVEGVRVGL